ncbi:MAG: antitoxin MazE family protein [Beijerinckiaceae bacterium]|nr:antitoxin MazE family protein [Beijerinckiaceae bacterium]
MPTNPARKTRAAEAARQRREKLRAKGMREIRIWVPDTRAPGFAEEARRQSLAVANSPGEKEDIAFVEAITASWDE